MSIITPSQDKSTPISKNVTPTTKRDPQGKGLPALAVQASPAPLEFAGEITLLDYRNAQAEIYKKYFFHKKIDLDL